jgi:hypothetical protein
MRVLGTSVLAMESLVMGFALLLAMDSHGSVIIFCGGLIAILLILNAGIMKRRFGWISGSVLQVAVVSYGFIVTSMFFLGVLFSGLWIAAYVVGRKGEAIRADLLRSKPVN